MNQNLLYAEFGSERFQTFRKTNGYANAPLDGLWLRAPYLHNGSVPTLARAALAARRAPRRLPARLRRLRPRGDGLRQRPRPHRPRRRGRSSSATSPAPTPPPSARPARPPMNGTCDAGPCRGNGNAGHLWGTTLPPADKRALIEYLKTF